MQMSVVKLNNDIFRTDFPVEALEVMPRGLHILKMKWAAGSHINQIIDTVNLWSKAIDDEPVALTWTAANEYAGEFWNKMSADAAPCKWFFCVSCFSFAIVTHPPTNR